MGGVAPMANVPAHSFRSYGTLQLPPAFGYSAIAAAEDSDSLSDARNLLAVNPHYDLTLLASNSNDGTVYYTSTSQLLSLLYEQRMQQAGGIAADDSLTLQLDIRQFHSLPVDSTNAKQRIIDIQMSSDGLGIAVATKHKLYFYHVYAFMNHDLRLLGTYETDEAILAIIYSPSSHSRMLMLDSTKTAHVLELVNSDVSVKATYDEEFVYAISWNAHQNTIQLATTDNLVVVDTDDLAVITQYALEHPRISGNDTSFEPHFIQSLSKHQYMIGFRGANDDSGSISVRVTVVTLNRDKSTTTDLGDPTGDSEWLGTSDLREPYYMYRAHTLNGWHDMTLLSSNRSRKLEVLGRVPAQFADAASPAGAWRRYPVAATAKDAPAVGSDEQGTAHYTCVAVHVSHSWPPLNDANIVDADATPCPLVLVMTSDGRVAVHCWIAKPITAYKPNAVMRHPGPVSSCLRSYPGTPAHIFNSLGSVRLPGAQSPPLTAGKRRNLLSVNPVFDLTVCAHPSAVNQLLYMPTSQLTQSVLEHTHDVQSWQTLQIPYTAAAVPSSICNLSLSVDSTSLFVSTDATIYAYNVSAIVRSTRYPSSNLLPFAPYTHPASITDIQHSPEDSNHVLLLDSQRRMSLVDLVRSEITHQSPKEVPIRAIHWSADNTLVVVGDTFVRQYKQNVPATISDIGNYSLSYGRSDVRDQHSVGFVHSIYSDWCLMGSYTTTNNLSLCSVRAHQHSADDGAAQDVMQVSAISKQPIFNRAITMPESKTLTVVSSSHSATVEIVNYGDDEVDVCTVPIDCTTNIGVAVDCCNKLPVIRPDGKISVIPHPIVVVATMDGRLLFYNWLSADRQAEKMMRTWRPITPLRNPPSDATANGSSSEQAATSGQPTTSQRAMASWADATRAVGIAWPDSGSIVDKLILQFGTVAGLTQSTTGSTTSILAASKPNPFAAAMPKTGWTCPTCDINNPDSVSVCRACEAPNPHAPAAATTSPIGNAASKPAVTFGSSAPITTTSRFGTVSSIAAASSSSFGSSSGASSASAAPSFSFASKASTSSFVFPATDHKPQDTPAKPFSFGSTPTQPASQSTATSAATPVQPFGLVSSPNAASNSTAAVPFSFRNIPPYISPIKAAHPAASASASATTSSPFTFSFSSPPPAHSATAASPFSAPTTQPTQPVFAAAVLSPQTSAVAKLSQLLVSERCDVYALEKFFSNNNKCPLRKLNAEGRHVISCAVQSNNKELVNFLLKRDAELLNLADEHGKTALYYALTLQWPADGSEMTRYLLSKGANADREEYSTSSVYKFSTDDKAQEYELSVDGVHLSLVKRYWLKRARLVPIRELMQQKLAALQLSKLREVCFGVIGQSVASALLLRSLMTFRVDREGDEGKKPLVLLFCGPPGHGKTMLGQTFRDAVGCSDAYLFYDCTKPTNKFELFGAAPSYVGAKNSTALGSFLRQHDGKQCVVLLDEFEKMSQRDMFEGFLAPFENGLWTDKQNAKDINCSDAIFILTSNLLDRVITSYFTADKHKSSYTEDEIVRIRDDIEKLSKPLMQAKFGEPFCRRVDGIIPFLPFSMEEQQVVSATGLNDICYRYAKPTTAKRHIGNCNIRFTDNVARVVAQEYDPSEGASSIKSSAKRQVKELLVQMWLTEKAVDAAWLTVNDENKIRLTLTEVFDENKENRDIDLGSPNDFDSDDDDDDEEKEKDDNKQDNSEDDDAYHSDGA